MSATKQVQKDLEDNPAELLLRRFKYIEEVKEKARKFNLNAGLDERLMTTYVSDERLFQEQRYLKWLNSVTDHNGRFLNTDILRARSFIAVYLLAIYAWM